VFRYRECRVHRGCDRYVERELGLRCRGREGIGVSNREGKTGVTVVM
jgi:hypothetical protein